MLLFEQYCYTLDNNMKESGPEKNHKFLTEYAPINDALVQFVQFKNFLRLVEKPNGLEFEVLKKTISESSFKKLGELTEKSEDDLEKIKKGINKEYNSLVQRIEDLKKIDKKEQYIEELKSIIQKAESLMKIG